MASADQQTFDRNVRELESRFLTQYPLEVSYIKQTWLEPYKQMLVKAWVD